MILMPYGGSHVTLVIIIYMDCLYGKPVVQIRTGGLCAVVLKDLEGSHVQFIVENVGEPYPELERVK